MTSGIQPDFCPEEEEEADHLLFPMSPSGSLEGKSILHANLSTPHDSPSLQHSGPNFDLVTIRLRELTPITTHQACIHAQSLFSTHSR